MSESGKAAGRKFKTRKKLFEAADALFYAQGVRATSVDAVAESAGVTKVTLYSHFASKDELVATHLGERDRRWWESLEDTLSDYADPEDRILAVLEAYREWLMAGGLRGCAFVNCAAEFPDPAHPAREIIRRHEAGGRERLRELTIEAGAEDPESLSERLFIIFEGAYVTAALEDDEQLFARIRTVVKDLVRAAKGRTNA